VHIGCGKRLWYAYVRRISSSLLFDMQLMHDHTEDDFLDEVIEERRTNNPAFRAIVDGAYERRILLRQLAVARKAAKLSRTVVAARMGTSEAAVARLEAATVDPKASTIERYAAAVGKRVQWEIVDSKGDVQEP
jgi:ribosome-binding protein aMBF1 (putative translation factor)